MFNSSNEENIKEKFLNDNINNNYNYYDNNNNNNDENFSNIEIQTLNDLKTLAKNTLSNEKTTKDFEHILRVYKTSISIAKKEKIKNLFEICVISLIYEIIDKKSKEIKEILNFQNIKLDFNDIQKISLKNNHQIPNSKECKIVQDAEIIDSLGAMGICRCFLNGGLKGMKIYSYENEMSSYNEFYDKLFKLKNYINTNEGKKIALKKTEFMVKFIKQFNSETFLDYFQNEYDKYEKIEKEVKKDKIKFFKEKMNKKLNNLIQKEKDLENKRIDLINQCDNPTDKILLEKIFSKERAKNLNNLEQTRMNIKKEIKLYEKKNK